MQKIGLLMKFNRLKQVRVTYGKTINEVATFLNIATTSYIAYENGKRILSSEQYRKLAVFYGVSVDYIMGADLIKGEPDSNAVFAKTEEERELILLFRELSPYLQDLTLNNLRSWSGASTVIYKERHKK